MKTKVIWFLNQNSYLPEDGPHTRHFTLGKYLNDYGYRSIVFAGNELHHTGGTVDTGGRMYVEKKRNGVRFLYIKTHHYEKNDIHRILNILSYYKNLFKVAKDIEKKYGKPDVIYASNMYPTALMAGEKLAKKYGVPCICENRDLIPDGFVTKGTFSGKGLIAKAMSLVMKRIYYKADALVFTMTGGMDYIRKHHWDTEHGGKIGEVSYICNGVDLDAFEENAEKYILPDDDLDSDVFKVVYFGAIRFLNQMPLFVETAKVLKERGVRAKILMWGNGTKLDEMRKTLEREGLDNIVLKGYVEKKYIPGIAKRADMFIGTGNSCCVGDYGMSFNKLFDYLAGGKPILLPFDVAGNPIDGAGFMIKDASAEDMADAIKHVIEMPKEEYEKMCENALEKAKEYDYRKLTGDVNEIIRKTGVRT